MDHHRLRNDAIGTGESNEPDCYRARCERVCGSFEAERLLRSRYDTFQGLKRVRLTLQRFLALALSLGFLQSHAAEIRVFAAASLTDSLKEIASAYEKRNGDKVVFNFGASSTLARQIQEGAPADIFFSADEAKMDGLESKGLIEKGSRKDRLSNRLVIIVAADNGATLNSPKDLTTSNIKRVALGDPRAVPIGVYAREYLEKLKLWDAIKPKVV